MYVVAYLVLVAVGISTFRKLTLVPYPRILVVVWCYFVAWLSCVAWHVRKRSVCAACIRNCGTYISVFSMECGQPPARVGRTGGGDGLCYRVICSSWFSSRRVERESADVVEES